MSAISAVRPRIGDRLVLSALWMAVIAATLVYWESCRLASGATAINLRDSGLWMMEIWSGWLVLSFPAFDRCRRWSRSVEGLRLRKALALMATLSVLALCCEWLLNMALAQLGGIERWESAWAMLNRRALLCVVVSGAIVLLATRPSLFRRKPASPERPVADATPETRNDATLVLMGRDGPITVSPHDIEAILAAENYVQICMANGKRHLHRTTLARIESEPSCGRMLRVHRSAIVNIDKVRDRLPGWRLQLVSGRVIRVGRSFRQAFDQGMRAPRPDSSS